MIGIDWGTSSLRAYHLDAAGAVIARLETDQGILKVPQGGFREVLRALIDPWLLGGETLVLLCGMVGSRQGWQEAPYLPCPAGPEEIAQALTPLEFDGARCLLVPGLSTADRAGAPDVMRGEETKLIGLLAELGDAAAVACLPGTHSKWARLVGGRIAGFATHMTGEVRATLLAHSILGRLAEPGEETPGTDLAFLRGVRRAREPGGLLHHLFGTRALGLMGRLAPADTDAYLSGLLIGHEVASALADGPLPGPVHLVGSERLCRLYALAFGEAGLAHRPHDADLVAKGLARIARSLG